MKTLLYSLICFIFLLVTSVGFASAQTSRPTPRVERVQQRMENVQERQETRQNALQERRENIQQNVQERQENRQEVRSEIASRHADRLSRRFTFYYTRLSNQIKKLEARLGTMQSEGKDVSAALAKLSEAKRILETAKTLADQAVSAFNAIDPATASEQREEAQSARDLAMQAREQFKTVVSLLKEVIRLAKAA